MATVIDDHLLHGENVMLYGPYLRGIPFYLGKPVVLWNASHAEFGHVVSPERSPNALQRDLGALAERLEQEQSLLILSGDPGGLEQLGRAALLEVRGAAPGGTLHARTRATTRPVA